MGKSLSNGASETGWAHLYLYDDQGNLKNRITKGPWHVERVVKVDPATRTIYFTANGREANENPYYEHLYKVNADGSGLKRLTEGEYFHETDMDDDARFIVDNYSRVNTVPNTVLIDRNGNKVMDLQESDFSQPLPQAISSPSFLR